MARLLYKYTNIDAAMKIVHGLKLKWSCPLEFNDPYDSQLNIFHGVDMVDSESHSSTFAWTSPSAASRHRTGSQRR